LYRCPHSRFFVRGISFEDVAAHADHGNCQTVTRRACLQPVVMLHSVLAETCSTLPPSYLAGCGPRGAGPLRQSCSAAGRLSVSISVRQASPVTRATSRLSQRSPT
jgi:alpha-mannosidase